MSGHGATVTLPGGQQVPQLGQGTWQMALDTKRRADEIAALRAGLDLGLTLIDTAEMYGEGRAEELVAEAIDGRRDEVFIVSKVYPYNASRAGVIAACERSLRRLQTDRIDLYLLHWMGRHPLAETVAGFEDLKRAGNIRHWGVSNLDTDDVQALWDVGGGRHVATNQILYNLTRRAAEWSLLPWQRERGIPTMAYSPVEQARLITNPRLVEFSRRHDARPAQVALAWLLAKPDLIVIPKAGSVEHVEENAAARSLRLSDAQLAELEEIFPAPRGPVPLDML
jgi:diketogulonate reductase-like aldo/keto reductase